MRKKGKLGLGRLGADHLVVALAPGGLSAGSPVSNVQTGFAK